MREKEAKKVLELPPSFIVPNAIDCYGVSVNGNREKDDIIGRNLKKIEQLKIGDRDFVLLFLGRIHPVKNIELIQYSMASLLKENHNLMLIIAGPIEDNKYYEMLKEFEKQLGLSEHIIWYGIADEYEKQELFSISDVMVLPSATEGMSMSLIEAMNASLPVLLTRKAANANDIEAARAAILVEPTKEDVEDNLRRVLNHPDLLDEVGSKAKQFIIENYEAGRAADLMALAFKDVLSRERSEELCWE